MPDYLHVDWSGVVLRLIDRKEGFERKSTIHHTDDNSRWVC